MASSPERSWTYGAGTSYGVTDRHSAPDLGPTGVVIRSVSGPPRPRGPHMTTSSIIPGTRFAGRYLARGEEGYEAARVARIFSTRHPERYPAAILFPHSDQGHRRRRPARPRERLAGGSPRRRAQFPRLGPARRRHAGRSRRAEGDRVRPRDPHRVRLTGGAGRRGAQRVPPPPRPLLRRRPLPDRRRRRLPPPGRYRVELPRLGLGGGASRRHRRRHRRRPALSAPTRSRTPTSSGRHAAAAPASPGSSPASTSTPGPSRRR